MLVKLLPSGSISWDKILKLLAFMLLVFFFFFFKPIWRFQRYQSAEKLGLLAFKP